MRTWIRFRILGLVLAGLLAVPLLVLSLQAFSARGFPARGADGAPGASGFRLAGPAPTPLPAAPPTATAGASPSAQPAVFGVRYGFDQGLGDSVHSLEGRLSLRARTAAGGTLTTTPHGAGLAVRFPRPCAKYGTPSCQRAILQSGPADFL